MILINAENWSPNDISWRVWLRHCATGVKVAGSISDGLIGGFSLT
jgi:hypothetical protein